MRPLPTVIGAVCATMFNFASAPTRADDCHRPVTTLDLPAGFQPEGITSGRGNRLYVAGIASGGIYALDARSGRGKFLVPPSTTGRQAIGLKYDRRSKLLLVAGGGTGHAYAYDAVSGAPVADFVLAADASTTNPSFINDVIITADGAYFTDSFRPALYRLPLDRDGDLPGPSAVQVIPLQGDYQHVPGQFNANGIETTPSGRELIVVNGHLGILYRVDPRTGVATAIDVDGEVNALVNGDGLVRKGRTLYIVENFSSEIDVVDLQRRADRGRVVRTITSPDLDVPATAVLLGDALYVTNARFTTTPTATTPYWVTRVPVKR